MNRKKRVLFVVAFVLVVLIVWTLWGNTALEVNEYEVVSDRIPQGFEGFRIAQVSDLHNAEFGEGNEKLIQLLSQTDPGIIVLTGDLIDSRHTDIEIALDFARQAIKLAPVYYVSGNHEARVREYEDLKMGLAEAGVVILENQNVQITREGESITLMGIDDPSFQEDYLFGDSESVARQAIDDLQNESEGIRSCYLTGRSCLISMSILEWIWYSLAMHTAASSACHSLEAWLLLIRVSSQSLMRVGSQKKTPP